MDIVFHKTHLGWLELRGTSNGLRFSGFASKPDHNPTIPDYFIPWIEQIDNYFSGQLSWFNIPMDLSGHNSFHQEVWKILQLIPFGKTRNYSEIAGFAGNPKAVRATANAIGQNPLAIIIPCHRVIGKSGNLTGYAYGLEIKKALLEFENPGKFGDQTELFPSEVYTNTKAFNNN
jgi:methylated-DNA-[protein]-cysteine S-methyltransferase